MQYRRSSLITILVATAALLIGAPLASAQGEGEDSAALIKKGEKMLKAGSLKKRLEGAKLIEQAYKQSPEDFDAMVAMARATAMVTKGDGNKKRVKTLAKAGWEVADKVIAKFPNKAEGYYWAAVNIGRYASTLSVMDAISEGVAGKMEDMAKAALKRNPNLYKGAPQLVLGRYYTSLPWPKQDLDKAEKYLREAYSKNPDSPRTLLYLAEALHKQNKQEEALKLFRECAEAKRGDRESRKECQTWLANNGR